MRLDLVPLVAIALGEVRSLAPAFLKGSIPVIDTAATPDRQRAELAAALGRPLAADFGHITLLKSDQVSTAQRAVRLFDTAVWFLLALTVALIAQPPSSSRRGGGARSSTSASAPCSPW